MLTCNLLHTLTSPNETPQVAGAFGSSVALGEHYQIVGAPLIDLDEYDNVGSVSVFRDSATEKLFDLKNPSPADNDNFGYSVAAHGEIVVVGTPQDDSLAVDSGAVYIYDLSSSDPETPVHELLQPSAEAGASFGWSVAVAGNYVAVGAPFADDNGTDSGKVYVYDLNLEEPLVPQQTLFHNSPVSYDRFGWSLAVGGSYVVVGTPYDFTTRTEAGSASVFDLASPNPEAAIVELQTPVARSFVNFGYSVAVGGELVVVGTPRDDGSEADQGAAYVFDLSSNSPSEPISTLINPLPTRDARFGNSVAISNSLIVVGAHQHDTNLTSEGIAFVYAVNELATPLQTLHNPQPSIDAQMGFSVAAFGDQVLVGARNNSAFISQAGTAFLFDMQASSPAEPTRFLTNTTPFGDLYGGAVAAHGNYLAVGASSADMGLVSTDAGAVYLYETFAAAQPPLLIATLHNPTPTHRNGYGSTLAMSGGYLVVGAPQDDTGAEDTGSAFVYDLDSLGNGQPLVTLRNPTPSSSERFAYSVAADGNTIVVGARNERTGASGAGSAYVYDMTAPDPTIPLHTINNPTPEASDWFGWSVAVSGDYVVATAPRDNTGATNAGAAYVYDLGSPSPTTPLITIPHPQPTTNAWFGRSVAAEGDYVAVGVPYENAGDQDDGSVIVYSLTSPTPEVPIATINNPAPAYLELFGGVLDLHENYLAIGTFLDNTLNGKGGSAYLYDLDASDIENPIAKFNNPSPDENDYFGRAIAMTDETVVVGAFREDMQNFDQGAVYVFETGELLGEFDRAQQFYNDSYFDGYDPAISLQDDLAIAPDKVPLLLGETAAASNVTGYRRGINGISVDLTCTPEAVDLSLDDFEFHIGNTDDALQWPVAPDPAEMNVRDVGNGVARVDFVWNDQQIINNWLQVTILANSRTGLADHERFYFGNQVGDVNGDGQVNATDFALVRANPANFLNPATTDNDFDLNRDGRVNALDLLIIRDNATAMEDALPLITPSRTPQQSLGSGSSSTPSVQDILVGENRVYAEAETRVEVSSDASPPTDDTVHDAALLALLAESTESRKQSLSSHSAAPFASTTSHAVTASNLLGSDLEVSPLGADYTLANSNV